jgi:hypothetical protein
VACCVNGLVGLAELGDGGGLAGAGRAGQDQAAAGGDRVPVEQGQSASGGDDRAQGAGRDRGEPGVVVQPQFVVGEATRFVQGLPLPGG